MVIYTAYFDESGTHGASPVTVMGGIVASAVRWQRFGPKFTRLKKKYGFKVFHTKKFRDRDGDFKGWLNDTRLALMVDMAKIAQKAFNETVTMSLDNAAYESDYKSGEKPRKGQLDSQYGLCFRNCLYHIAMTILRRGDIERPKVRIVLEAGHRNYGDAERIFLLVKEDLAHAGADILCSITKKKKDEADELMMADFVAHWTFLKETIKSSGKLRPTWAKKIDGGEGQSVTILRYRPGGLAEAKKQFIEAANRRQPHAS